MKEVDALAARTIAGVFGKRTCGTTKVQSCGECLQGVPVAKYGCGSQYALYYLTDGRLQDVQAQGVLLSAAHDIGLCSRREELHSLRTFRHVIFSLRA